MISRLFDIINQVFENAPYSGVEADRIRNIDIASPCIDCSLNDLQEEIQFRPSSGENSTIQT